MHPGTDIQNAKALVPGHILLPLEPLVALSNRSSFQPAMESYRLPAVGQDSAPDLLLA